MKILVVSQYFWPENFRINDLVQDLVRRGHEVTVLTGYPNYPTGKIFHDFKSNPSHFSQYCGTKIFRVPLIPRGTNRWCLVLNYLSFALNATIVSLYKLRNKDFDVIFVFEPSPITVGIPAIVLRRFKKAPVVFWVLDLWPETLEALGIVRSKTILWGIGWLVGFIYNRCDLVLGSSKGALQGIARFCSNKEKIRFFPNWAERVFEQTAIELAPETTPQAAVFNIVFAGNIGEAQDFPSILNAAKHLQSYKAIQWVIIGDGHLSLWLQKEVKRLSLEKCFLLVGQFPLERMPSFFAHADALLVTLKGGSAFSLTIPGKIQSYLMAAVPLLGMLDGEGADVIREAQAGLVCNAGNSIALANNVMRLSAMSKQKRAKLGQNARTYAEREFACNRMIDRLESWLYETSEREVV